MEVDNNNVNNNHAELEEGEAASYNDTKFDPDIDLAYIEDKLEKVLGHIQKSFEDEASSGTLGSKLGDYGTFLAPNEWSPSVIATPKTPPGICITSRSPKMSMEGASEKLKTSSNALPTMRLGNASSSAHFSHSVKVFGRVSAKEDSCVLSTHLADGCSFKDEKSIRSNIPTDQRTLKVRIKMHSDKTALKNKAIYSGLGLNSPSSSFGNSPEESAEMPPRSQLTMDQSPANILQVMTSFPVPGNVPLSPLHDTLIRLMRKKRPVQQKMAPPSEFLQRRCSLSDEELALTRDSGKLLKELKVEVTGTSGKKVEPKIENVTNVNNDMKILIKKKAETKTLRGKIILSNGYNASRPSNSRGDGIECAKLIGRRPNVSRVTYNNEVKGRLSSSELAEESLESVSGHGCDKNKKRNSRPVKKVQKQLVNNSHKNTLIDLRDEGTSKDYKFMPSLEYSGASQCKKELDLHTQSASGETAYPDEDKCNILVEKEQLSFEAKIKSKGKLRILPANLKEEILGVEMDVLPKRKLNGSHGVSPSSSQVQKLKLQKDTVRDNRRGSLGSKILIQRDRMDVMERPTDDVEEEWTSSKDKSTGSLSGKKVATRLMSGGSVKGAASTCPPTVVNSLNSEIAPAVPAPIVIEDNWVCCDSCQAWRLLPFGKKPEQLPEKWLCSMLDWLGPGMNRCDISEEETTSAVNALYQIPSSESLTNLQAHANGTSSVEPLGRPQHQDQNYQILSVNGMPNKGKKKNSIKEVPDASSQKGLLTSYPQEPLKCTSSNDMNQPPLEPNLMKKTGDRLISNLQNLDMEEKLAKEKDKQISRGGDANKLNLKHKEVTDHYTCGDSKKPKRVRADKDPMSDINLGRVCLTSINGVQTHEVGRDGKFNEFCRSEDTNDRIYDSGKKLGYQIQAKCSKGDSLLIKKRKREWQDNQNNVDTIQNRVHDGRVYTKEESSESGSQKVKKVRISKTDCKKSGTGNDDDKSDRKIRITKIVLSGTKAHAVDALKKDKSIVKVQQPGKHSRSNASHQNLEGANAFKRDLESGHVLLAATSSSSKVSGSHMIRGNFEEVKVSPVESVTSSPPRTSNSLRQSLPRGDGFGKDDAVCAGFSRIIDSQNCLDGDGNVSDDNRESMAHPKDAILLKRSDKGSCLQSKDIIRGSTYGLDRDKMNSDPANEYSKKSQKYASEMDCSHNVRHNPPEKCSPKPVKVQNGEDYVCRRDNAGQGSRDSGVETQSRRKSDEKLGASQTPIKFGAPQQTMNQDSECSQKHIKSRSAKPKVSSHSHSESKEGDIKNTGEEGCEGKEGVRCQSSQAVDWSEREVVFQGIPATSAVNGNALQSLKQSGTTINNHGVNRIMGHLISDQQGVVDVNASSPVLSSAAEIATKTLNEAKRLRDQAEQYKNGRFDFESSEAYFQAALKFLLGAALLESCSSEEGEHDMTPVQVYSTTAKLCESCAHEYERRKEVASATLAYKCMEVAYMRVVYCKNNSVHRERNEMQASSNMPPQGESPSSSASDIDNLNNQVMTEKALLSRGVGSHVAGNHVVVRNIKFVRLLEFTQDVFCAMEASRKYQGAFAAACLTLEDAHKNDCYSSIKRAIDFSFQDVEEFVRLVRLAMEAIGRSEFRGLEDKSIL